MSELEVVALAGLVTVQDGGRPGRMHEGVPPGGAFVPEWLAAANAAAGNPPGAAALEVFGTLRVRTTVATWVSLDGEAATPLAPAAGAPPVAPSAPSAVPDAALDATIRLVPGPDDDRFPRGALAALVATPLAIGGLGDRVGVRLAGPPEPPWRPLPSAATAASTPMLRGAIQVTPSGELVVLGPDHPTTGGYPVIAVIVAIDVGRLLGRRPGAQVRFGYAP